MTFTLRDLEPQKDIKGGNSIPPTPEPISLSLYKTAVITKLVGFGKIFGISITGITTFLSVEWITGSLPVAIVCQSFATIAGAWLVTRPKLAAVRSQHELSLLHELQRERTTSSQWMVERLEQQNKLVAALTITKHALAAELQSLTLHNDFLSDILAEHDIPHDKFRPRTFTDITKEEDKIRASIIGLDPDAVDRLQGEPRP